MTRLGSALITVTVIVLACATNSYSQMTPTTEKGACLGLPKPAGMQILTGSFMKKLKPRHDLKILQFYWYDLNYRSMINTCNSCLRFDSSKVFWIDQFR
jgi:hypothetical protein